MAAHVPDRDAEPVVDERIEIEEVAAHGLQRAVDDGDVGDLVGRVLDRDQVELAAHRLVHAPLQLLHVVHADLKRLDFLRELLLLLGLLARLSSVHLGQELIQDAGGERLLTAGAPTPAVWSMMPEMPPVASFTAADQTRREAKSPKK